MKTTKKLLAFIMASILLISVFAVGFTSFAAAPKVIDRVDLVLRTDIAGFTTADYKKIFTITTANVTFDNQRADYPDAIDAYYDGHSVKMSKTDKFDVSKEYAVYVYLAAAEGYTFAKEVKVYIDGKLSESIKWFGDYCAAGVDGVKVTERSMFGKIIDFFSELIAKGLEILRMFFK